MHPYRPPVAYRCRTGLQPNASACPCSSNARSRTGAQLESWERICCCWSAGHVEICGRAVQGSHSHAGDSASRRPVDAWACRIYGRPGQNERSGKASQAQRHAMQRRGAHRDGRGWPIDPGWVPESFGPSAGTTRPSGPSCSGGGSPLPGQRAHPAM
jgi:hypothetical protein